MPDSITAAARMSRNSFLDQDLAAVVTTAALAAGVDFPASQVLFDSLAMGIEWLSVQEFQPDARPRGATRFITTKGRSTC
ncbi:MAG: hypothetical protein A07HN63_00567 [uncultured archaeon A07HN63]|nr:MAG: hypothetical protein A07HN63_00567 [uncultured archaeon A07HN63]